jgi:hypothetical protein
MGLAFGRLEPHCKGTLTRCQQTGRIVRVFTFPKQTTCLLAIFGGGNHLTDKGFE